MKKILVVLGGGRPSGNTAQLAAAFEKGAAEAGHEVECISLNKLQVNGCTGCNACRKGRGCVLKDDFNAIVPKIKEADLLVGHIHSLRITPIFNVWAIPFSPTQYL